MRLAFALTLLGYAFTVTAQEHAKSNDRSQVHPASTPTTRDQAVDMVRIKTRVVFVDALVKDKKTNQPIRDRALEKFRVRDDGKPRTLSYFSRDGLTRS